MQGNSPWGCSLVESLEGVKSLATLEILLIPDCDKIEDLKPLAGLAAIRNLDVSGCSNLTSLDGIKTPAIKYIQFENCEQLSDVNALAGCRIRELEVRNCPAIKSLSVLTRTAITSRLVIAKCPNLSTVGLPMATNGNYDSVEISDCSKLDRLTVPQSPQGSLGSLSVEGDRANELLKSLGDGFRVQKLKVRNAKGLKDINSVGKLKDLKTLTLFNCDGLSDLQGLTASQTLTEICITDCDRLTKFSPQYALSSLSAVTIRRNRELETINLERMPAIRKLKVSQCPKLTTVTGLDDLSKLHELELEECGKIQSQGKLTFPK